MYILVSTKHKYFCHKEQCEYNFKKSYFKATFHRSIYLDLNILPYISTDSALQILHVYCTYISITAFVIFQHPFLWYRERETTKYFNTTSTFALYLEAWSAILIPASWVKENSCNESTPFSIFLICFPSLLIKRTFLHIFWGKANSWLGSVLLSPLLNSLNHLPLCGFFLFAANTYKSFATRFTSTLPSCIFSRATKGGQWGRSSCTFPKMGKKGPNILGKMFHCIRLSIKFLI